MLNRIAAAVCPQREHLVIEIGPGRGALTAKLLGRAERVVAIELDARLAEDLRSKFAAEPRLEVIEQDVLATDLSQWGLVPIAGNLPYYIATAIIERVARLKPPRAVFLIQEEVADRLIADPGTRDYGFLTIQVAARMDVRRLARVPPEAFYPPPKVASAVIVLEPAHQPPEVADVDRFIRFGAQCFLHKRKTLRNNLGPIYGKEVVESWPEAGLRAEQLSLKQFAELYRRLTG